MADAYYHPYRKALSSAQMQTNAVWLRNYLQTQGWTLNAIAGALGNWQSECTLNPNRPQRAGWPSDSGGGFGLAQWTGWYKKYGKWCISQNIGFSASDNNPAGRMEPQIAYHEYECTHGLNGGKTWYNNRGYHYTWDQWKHSYDSPDVLATAYYWQYERSAANSPGSRPGNAVAWYNFLSGQPYSPISGGSYQLNPQMQQSPLIGNLKLLWIYILILLILGGKR